MANKKSIKLILQFMFILMLTLDVFIVYKFFYQITYYDSSPELVLGNLLSKENKLLTTSWYYSTELRVFYTQIINSFLFKFISSYRIVNAVSLLLHLCLLEGSLYFFFNHVLRKKNDTFFWIAAIWLLIPYCWVWRLYVFDGLYYIPHFIIILLSLALFMTYLHLKEEGIIGWKRCILLAAQCLFALVAGMGGVRCLEITYLPLFASAFLIAFFDEKEKRIIKGLVGNTSVRLSFVLLVCAAIGYLINNKLLANIYHFSNYSEIKLVGFTWSRLELIISCINQNFAYITGLKLFGFSGIASICCFLIWIVVIVMALTIRKKFECFSREECAFFVFTAIQWVVNIFVLLFTDNACEPRYFLPQMITLTCAIIFFIRKVATENIISIRWKQTLCILLVIFALMEMVNGYHDWVKEDKNSPQLREVVSYLVENDYSLGYSEFYTGDAIPSLSDGKIDIYCVGDFNTLSARKWLMKVETGELREGNQRTFVLLTPDQYEKVKKLNYIKQGTIVNVNDSYVLIVYPNLTTLWGYV